ncbi:MAG: hypothetical protein ACPHUE_01825 [Flavobacteriaceae bacterium]
MHSHSNCLLLYLAVVLTLLASCESVRENTTTLVDWVPQNTPLVFQINDLNELENALTNNPILKYFPENFPQLAKKMKRLNVNEQTPQIISLTNFGKNEKALSVVYKAAIDSAFLNYPSVDYSGEKLYIQKDNAKLLYTAFIDGFTLHSDTKIVIENCIRNYQQKAKGIQSKVFYDIVKTADDKAPVNIHLKAKEESLLNTTFGALPLFPKIGQNWSSLDLTISPQAIELDGLIKLVDSIGDPVGMLQSNAPKKSFILKAIPATMVTFLSLTIDNIKILENKFKKWVLFHNYPLTSTDLTALESIDEIALIRLNNETALAFHLIDETRASSTFLPETETKRYRTTPYYKTRLSREIKALISGLGEDSDVQWVAKLDDFLLFGETESGIKTLIAAYKDEKTLGKNQSFEEFYNETLSEKSNLFWGANTAKLTALYPKNNLWKKLDTDLLPYLAFQGIVEDDYLHLHYRFHKNQTKQNQQTVNNVVLLSLDQPLSSAPLWLKNHRSKEKDIVVQDQDNVLYLFSNSGKLFWKKKLTGKIQGKISQVDLYKNGRLQIAFRTEDRFYVLDRNGKVVPPFNIKVPSTEPLQPLAVFDYDQRRDYRFVLAQGKSIQMFNGKGKKVKGFAFKKTGSPISAKPKHIRIDKKDYIVIKEENGTLNLLTRTGKPRIKVKTKFSPSNQDIYSYLKTFTTTSSAGDLIQIDTKGNIVKTDLALEKGHAINATTKSLVTLSENTLVIKGIPVTLPFGTYTPPKIFYLNNTIYVSVTNLEAEKVYLFYSDGSPVNGFPVYGTSAVDLTNADKDNALEMVVQSEQRDIIIYEIK